MRTTTAALLVLAAVIGRSASAQDPDPGSLRVGREGATAVRLAWTSPTPGTYCVLRDAVPAPAGVVSEVAGLAHVDDPPAHAALPGVWFYSVDASPAAGCTGTAPACAPAGTLACGSSIAGDVGGAASSDALSAHAGCGAGPLDGREQVWQLDAATDDVLRVALVTGASALDVLVLRDGGGGCAAATCLAADDDDVTVAVQAGQRYFVVVDGPEGAPGAYELAVGCGATQCASLGAVTCGSLRQDSNASSGVSSLDAYACTPFPMTGPESVYDFIAAQDGTMTVTLSGTTAELDVLVMQDVLGCQAESCIAFGDTTATFPLTAGTRYFVAIDGRSGAEGTYTATFTCATPPQECNPAGNVRCGEAWFSANDALGSTDVVDAHPCAPGRDASGREIVVQWIAPDDVTAVVSLSGTTADLDVFVLESRGAGCRSADCVAFGDDWATFEAVEGALYFFLVDGRAGARSDFRLFVDCVPAPGACLPARTIACGSVVSGRNDEPGSRDAIDQWTGCTPFPEDGPEVAYELVATATGTIDATLSGTTAELDLFVLQDGADGCTSAGCWRAGNDGVSFPATAGETYYVVVDGRSGAVGDYVLSISCN